MYYLNKIPSTDTFKFLLPVFIFINFTLYYFSYEGAFFIEGADASQYYKPALSLIEGNGKFLIGESQPLTFGPPLYSIFLAIPIGVFGFDNSVEIIIILQLLILFFTGYIFKIIFLNLYSGRLKNLFGFLLHALIILNPNSLITAHLCQSETLFTFLFSLALLFSMKLLSNFTYKNLIYIGIFSGLSALTRSVGLYFLIMTPFFLFTMVKFYPIKLHAVGLKLAVPILTGLLIISPWYVRNYMQFDRIFYTSNAGVYLQLQYIQLKNKGSKWSREMGEGEYRDEFKNYFHYVDDKKRDFCLKNNRHWSCNDMHFKISTELLLQESISKHVKALIDSWATLFFSGGASNIRNYLGIDGKNSIVSFQSLPYQGIKSIKNLLNNINTPYTVLLIVTTFFSLASRALGVFGLIYLIKGCKSKAYSFFLIEVLILFVAAYMYLGQSRFRVPLEPTLMLFTVFGIIYFLKRK